MAKYDPELRAHKDWLGLLQPVGLVVSPPALVKSQAVPSQNVAELQQQLLSVVEHPPASEPVIDEPALTNLPAFFQTVLGWSLDDIAGASGGPPLPDGLELVLPDLDETLRPTYVAVDSMGDGRPLMLVNVVSRSTAFDQTPGDDARTGWFASPQAKLERLLREVKVPAGLLCNGYAVRLVYAPGGESSGHLTFPVAAMCEVSGRPILSALDMLLSEHRVFSAPDGRRIGDILSESRRYQAEVSNALSDQVMGALWELLRGFQASDPEEETPQLRRDRSERSAARLRRAARGAHASHLRAVRRGRGAHARGRGLRQQLLGLGSLRPPSVRFRPLPGHDGSAVWRLRLAALPLPTHLRRRWPRGPAAPGTPRPAFQPRRVPVS